MKAKFSAIKENGKNYGSEKEMVSCYSVIGTYKGQLRESVTCRVYMGRSKSASSVYASIWVAGSVYASGTGTAGGWGYHKESAAIASAISSAGIELYGNQYADEKGMIYDYEKKEHVKENTKERAYIGGCGDSAVRSALIAIGKAAGLRGKIAIVNH